MRRALLSADEDYGDGGEPGTVGAAGIGIALRAAFHRGACCPSAGRPPSRRRSSSRDRVTAGLGRRPVRPATGRSCSPDVRGVELSSGRAPRRGDPGRCEARGRESRLDASYPSAARRPSARRPVALDLLGRSAASSRRPRVRRVLRAGAGRGGLLAGLRLHLLHVSRGLHRLAARHRRCGRKADGDNRHGNCGQDDEQASFHALSVPLSAPTTPPEGWICGSIPCLTKSGRA